MAENISAIRGTSDVTGLKEEKKVKEKKETESSVMDSVTQNNDDELISLRNHISTSNKHYLDITTADLSKGVIPSDTKILDKRKINNIINEYKSSNGYLSANSLTLLKIINNRYPESNILALTDEQIDNLNKEIIAGKHNDIIKKYTSVNYNDNLLIDDSKVTAFNSSEKDTENLYTTTVEKLKAGIPLTDNEKLMYALILIHTPLKFLPEEEEEKQELIKSLNKDLKAEESTLSNGKKLSNRINNITSQAADKELYDLMSPAFRQLYNNVLESFEMSTGKQSLFSNFVEAYRDELKSIPSNEKVETVRSYIADKLTVEEGSVVDKILPSFISKSWNSTVNIGEDGFQTFEDITRKNLGSIDNALKMRKDAKGLYKLFMGKDFSIQDYRKLVQSQIELNKENTVVNTVDKLLDILETNKDKNYSEFSEEEKQIFEASLEKFNKSFIEYLKKSKNTEAEKDKEKENLKNVHSMLIDMHNSHIKTRKNLREQATAANNRFFDAKDGDAYEFVTEYLKEIQERGNKTAGGFTTIAFALALAAAPAAAGAGAVAENASVGETIVAEASKKMALKTFGKTVGTKLLTGATNGLKLGIISSIPPEVDILSRDMMTNKLDSPNNPIEFVRYDEFKNMAYRFGGAVGIGTLATFTAPVVQKVAEPLMKGINQTGTALTHLGETTNNKILSNTATALGNTVSSTPLQISLASSLVTGANFGVSSGVVSGGISYAATGDMKLSLMQAGIGAKDGFLYGALLGGANSLIEMYSPVPAPEGTYSKTSKIIGFENSDGHYPISWKNGTGMKQTVYYDEQGSPIAGDIKLVKAPKHIDSTMSADDVFNMITKNPIMGSAPKGSTLRVHFGNVDVNEVQANNGFYSTKPMAEITIPKGLEIKLGRMTISRLGNTNYQPTINVAGKFTMDSNPNLQLGEGIKKIPEYTQLLLAE